MIQFCIGNNVDKRQAHTRALVSEYQTKGFDLRFVDGGDAKDVLESYVHHQDLFGASYVVVSSYILGDQEVADLLATNQAAFVNSPHAFIFVDDEIGGELEAQYSNAVVMCQLPKKASARPDGKIFGFADVIGTRNKKNIWLQFQAGLIEFGASDLHRIALWGVKNMLLVKRSGEENPGLNAYVFKKNVGYARNFSESELIRMSRDLVIMHHDQYRGKDIATELEAFILKL